MKEKKEEYVNPSLGKIGEMYYDQKNNRIKFFSVDIHKCADSVDDLVQSGLDMMQNHGATRLNARFFVRRDIRLSNVEAIIPLKPIYEDISLVFIGINDSVRVSSHHIKKQEDQIIIDVQKSHPKRHKTQGHIIERLNPYNITLHDLDDLVKLYNESFTTYTSDLNQDTVKAMIENSVVYGVRDLDRRQIVSTSVAEMGLIKTSEFDFRICELSEMATKKEYRGNGLVTQATRMLIQDIQSDVDLIYAEARACHGAINKSFHNLGFRYAGRLKKQCILSGDHEVSEEGPYENLNVWYIIPNISRTK